MKNTFLKIASLLFVYTIIVCTAIAANPTAKVDTKKSTLGWAAKKVTGAHNGKVNISSGSFTLNGNVVTGGRFEVDMTSITCEDITDKETNGKLIGHLKSDDFFSVAGYPKATFTITEAKQVKGNEYEIKGNLTIKGKTNEISFPADINVQAKTITAKANVKIDRTKWDIRYGSGKFFENLGDKMIYDEFELNVNLVASR
jgi:polyisoprenoid-binding protein YceI